MVRPDAGHFPAVGVAVALSAAFVTACVSLVLRELGRTESAGVIVFWLTLLSLPPLGAAMLFHGQAHDAATWGLMLLIGLSGGIAKICQIADLRSAPISVALPLYSTSIVATTLRGVARKWRRHSK